MKPRTPMSVLHSQIYEAIVWEASDEADYLTRHEGLDFQNVVSSLYTRMYSVSINYDDEILDFTEETPEAYSTFEQFHHDIAYRIIRKDS